MAARGLAVIARRFAPKLLKHVGSAVAGSVLSKAFDKLFGKGRRRRRRRIRGGFRLFKAPGLVRDRPLVPRSFVRSSKRTTTTRRRSARGGCRYRRRRGHRK